MATYEKRVGKKGVTWRARVRRSDGPWLTKSFVRKDDARRWATSIEGKLDAGDSVPGAEARKRTLADAIDHYLKATLPYQRRNKNADEQKRLLAWWREHYGDRRLTSLSRPVIDDARLELGKRESRAGKPISGATVNRYVVALSAVLSAAVQQYEWIPKNPVHKLEKRQEAKGRERFLSDGERTALLAACDRSDEPGLPVLVRLALATGARRGELLALQWAGVNLERRTVRFLDTKNGETRTVPLAASAVDVLKAWGKGRLKVGPVFLAEDHHLEKVWQAARIAAKIPDFRFHDLRHSAASYLAMSGASLLDIAAILGHKTLAMVKRYSHLSEQHTIAAVDRMAEKFLG